MLAAFEQMASGNAKGGFPLSRICCRMDWAVEDRSYVDDLIEFESRVNDVWTRHEDAVICTYHLGKFGGDTVIDIMRTHPLIIIGGILQQNPFFVPLTNSTSRCPALSRTPAPVCECWQPTLQTSTEHAKLRGGRFAMATEPPR